MTKNTTAAPTIEKLDPNVDGSSLNILGQNMEAMRSLFPEVFTEGSDDDGPRWKVDLEKLGELLGEYAEEKPERFSFNWHGKSRARRIAQTPSTGTLRPCPDESVNWDTTKNIFIEGDNLEVLKLLQKSYHKKIKLIFIDPPYNTGKEFVYPDNFQDNLETYLRFTGQIGGEGFRFSAKNNETSGRYHTNWLNMMLPRLKLARNLLKEDGAIFISIDDHEVANLRKLCDEIFGEENFVANVIWEKKYSPSNDAKWLSDNHDHILVYAKNKSEWRPTLLPRNEKQLSRYKNLDDDPRGAWKPSGLDVKTYSAKYDYEIETPSGRIVRPPGGACWRYSKEKFAEMIADNRIWFGDNGGNVPAIKRFLSEVKDGITPLTLWRYDIVGHNQDATKEIKNYFGTSAYFDTPKPIELLKRIVQIGTGENDICLDFFAGSATTADAVLRLNKQDDKKRQFIMVQLPHPYAEDSRAYADGYRNIAEVSRERIRRASSDINDSKLDSGFRTFQLASSNFIEWDCGATDMNELLLNSVNSVKSDRTHEDILQELILKFGLPLGIDMEKHSLGSHSIYSVGAGSLVVCLDDNINIEIIEKIAQFCSELSSEFVRIILREGGFSSDVEKTNAFQIFQQHGLRDVHSV